MHTRACACSVNTPPLVAPLPLSAQRERNQHVAAATAAGCYFLRGVLVCVINKLDERFFSLRSFVCCLFVQFSSVQFQFSSHFCFVLFSSSRISFSPAPPPNSPLWWAHAPAHLIRTGTPAHLRHEGIRAVKVKSR